MSILQKSEADANSVINVLLCTDRLKISPAKKTKNNGDKSAVFKSKDARQLGCVFQDIEPPKSSSILRKSTNVLRPIRRVPFSKATLRHANIRESTGPSLGMICPVDSCERSFYVPNSRTDLRRGRRDKSDAPAETRGEWPKIILKLTEKDKATFFSLTEVWCHPAPSVIKPEEREIVAESGASMNVLSRKDLNSAELETVRVSKSPRTVVATNREVQTNEEATVYVK